MSASREKKNRQELAAQGYVDPKTEREAKEAAERKKNKLLYGGIAIVFVIVAAVVLLYNSGVFQRNATALTVDGKNFTAAEVDYYYYGALNSVSSSQYASYMGLNTSTSMKDQTLNAMAKMLLGVTDEGDITWDQFLKDTAKNNLTQTYLLSEKAKADGLADDEHISEEVSSTVETVKGYAKHEKELLERITQARSAAMNATSINGKIEADNALTSALAGLKVQVEAYPELKANQNFLQLQSEISDVENKLAATRRFFNSATKELNNGVQTFPAVLFAGMFGFHREPMFEVPASERANYDKAPEVKF